MNRRGFLASLLAAPLAPKALVPVGDIVRRVSFKVSSSTLNVAKLMKAKRALQAAGPFDYRAEYIRSFNQARSRMIDQAILKELSK